MRIVLAGFIIVLLVISCGLAVKYNQNANIAQGKLDGERYNRIMAEESLQKSNLEISSLNTELKRVRSKMESTEMVLEKIKAINTDYKDRLDRAAVIQSNLDKRVTELQQMVGTL